MLKSSLEFFDCFSLNPNSPDLYMNTDASVICEGDYHNLILNGTAIPGIVIWGVLYPLIFYMVLNH